MNWSPLKTGNQPTNQPMHQYVTLYFRYKALPPSSLTEDASGSSSSSPASSYEYYYRSALSFYARSLIFDRIAAAAAAEGGEDSLVLHRIVSELHGAAAVPDAVVLHQKGRLAKFVYSVLWPFVYGGKELELAAKIFSFYSEHLEEEEEEEEAEKTASDYPDLDRADEKDLACLYWHTLCLSHRYAEAKAWIGKTRLLPRPDDGIKVKMIVN